jgi:prepilin-type processing-associated H-X9-DG protein/prepilin-type N-terminal cleavage/methylation domain-containing protein
MNSDPCSGQTRAFTLVELLTVIAIIAILAALLLPVLDKSEMSGKRAWCINNLTQIGLAFHSFANDHGGKFPMAISTNEGGSLEYVESGFNSGPTFYTAYYHFLVLSNELVFPRILICQTDLRIAATNFPSLQNENLSYFAGVNATFDKPESVLAGDRNLATNSWSQPTILGYSPASSLSWTWEMHQHKGNILFADGHVEQWNDYSLGSGANEVPGNQSFFLPSVIPAENPYANTSQGSGNGGSGDGSGSDDTGGHGNSASGSMPSSSGNSSPSAQQNASSPNNRQPSFSYNVNNPLGSRTADSKPAVPSDTANPPPAASQANAPGEVTGDSDSGMSDFNRELTRRLQHDVVWGYFLLWLLLLLYVSYRIWRWCQKRDAKLRAEMARRIPHQYDEDGEDSSR